MWSRGGGLNSYELWAVGYQVTGWVAFRSVILRRLGQDEAVAPMWRAWTAAVQKNLGLASTSYLGPGELWKPAWMNNQTNPNKALLRTRVWVSSLTQRETVLESRRQGEYQSSDVCDLVLASAFEKKCHPGHLVAERIGGNLTPGQMLQDRNAACH